jgi:arabinofuranosyltransferase
VPLTRAALPSVGWATRGIGLVLLLVVLHTLWMVAWQGDDAYITHRTALNLLRGDGLTWNPGYRVQAFTHPLWLVVSVLGHLATGEPYYSVLVVSAVLTLGVLIWLARVGPSGLVAAGVLSASTAWMDWTVSGLENPLLSALVVGGFVLAARRWTDRDAALAGGLLAALYLTRPDAPLLVVPLVAWKLFEGRQPRLVALFALGTLPLLAWEAFSLLWFGSLVPNTAWAKLNVDIPSAEMAAQGFAYLADAASRDPMVLVLPLVAGAALTRASSGQRALALGGMLYVAYVVRIGGDFMAMRFLTAPLVICAGLVALNTPRLPVWGLAGLIALAGLAPGSPWYAEADYGLGLKPDENLTAAGIANERQYYYPYTGIARVAPAHGDLVQLGPVPPFPEGLRAQREYAEGRRYSLGKMVGYYGYFGPDILIVDQFALTDPFLARVPYAPADGWRVGHYIREVPEEYLASLEAGSSQFSDPAVGAAFDDVMLVTSAPLLAPGRLEAIWRLNTGAHDEAFATLTSRGDGTHE